MKNFKTYLAAAAMLTAAALTVDKASAQAAQGSDDASTIAIMAVAPTEADGLPAGAGQALKNKMDQIASATGLGSMSDYAQFCMVVAVDTESKDVLAGSPPKIAQTLNFNFRIIDRFDGKVFSSTSVRAKAVGDNETRSYVQAIRQLNARSSELASFVDAGRQKIIEYYNANCDRIIAKSRSLATQEQYGEALFLLTQIPDVCEECYMKSMAAAGEIFQAYMDKMCSVNLAKARSIWSATQTSEGGLAAGVFLAEIYPDAACYPEAEQLYKEITARIGKNLDFEMKKWDDLVSLESQRIEAVRAIGVTWGENQQPVNYSATIVE
ncbi:MAG: hypothetical protein LBV18_04990 [Alistipes sp.]|jgi:hypothetical protein|nr:hypothetical protein [Alistipes sp.]